MNCNSTTEIPIGNIQYFQCLVSRLAPSGRKALLESLTQNNMNCNATFRLLSSSLIYRPVS